MIKTTKNETSKRHCMVVFARYPLGETRVQREAEALVRRGYEVDVICLRTLGSLHMDAYKGVKIYREKFYFFPKKVIRGGLLEKFQMYLNFFITSSIQLTRLHFKNHYDTIQVHNLPDFLVFSAVIPKLLGVSIILDLHDLMPEFFSGVFRTKNQILNRLICLQESISCRFADHVITVSEHWRQTLMQRGVPQHKCSVVMNVADEKIFHPSEIKGNQKHTNEGFRLIYHGAMVERYGLDLAIKAVNRLRFEIPGIHLSLIGFGDYLPQIKSMIKELDLAQHVSIEYSRLAEDLPEIIQSCHLGVVPYRNDFFTDGLLPTKLMEYASLGMPAVAARTTTIQTYFSDANVEFFEPGNVDDLARCILMLYRNPDRLAELARGSDKFNQRYNWTRVSEDYVNLVERLGSRGVSIPE